MSVCAQDKEWRQHTSASAAALPAACFRVSTCLGFEPTSITCTRIHALKDADAF